MTDTLDVTQPLVVVPVDARPAVGARLRAWLGRALMAVLRALIAVWRYTLTVWAAYPLRAALAHVLRQRRPRQAAPDGARR